MTQLRVDSELIEHAVVNTQLAIERVRTEHAALTANLENLQHSWSGEASAAFQGHVQRWRVVHQQIDEEISLLNQALAQAGNAYRTAEQDIHRAFLGGAG